METTCTGQQPGAAALAGSTCGHSPQCPPADAPGRLAARVVAAHPEQGWSLLCNGVIAFDDGGAIGPEIPATLRRPGRAA